MNQPGEPGAPSPQTAVPALPADRPAPSSRTDRVPALAWVIGAAFMAVELAVSGRYGQQGAGTGCREGAAGSPGWFMTLPPRCVRSGNTRQAAWMSLPL